MRDPSPPVRARGLTKHYGQRTVLRQIDLEIAAGQAVALRGSNGAGKTTLLRCLASITRPTSGQVWWFGRAASETPALRRWVGMVAHESRLYPHLTLRENLLFAGRMYGIEQPAERADQLLADVGLAAHGERLAGAGLARHGPACGGRTGLGTPAADPAAGRAVFRLGCRGPRAG